MEKKVVTVWPWAHIRLDSRRCICGRWRRSWWAALWVRRCTGTPHGRVQWRSTETAEDRTRGRRNGLLPVECRETSSTGSASAFGTSLCRWCGRGNNTDRRTAQSPCRHLLSSHNTHGSRLSASPAPTSIESINEMTTYGNSTHEAIKEMNKKWMNEWMNERKNESMSKPCLDYRVY